MRATGPGPVSGRWLLLPFSLTLALSLSLSLYGCASSGADDGDEPPPPKKQAESAPKSSNPARRQLERRGVAFTPEAFLTAARTGDVESVELFLDAGMDPNAANSYGSTALVEASRNGKLDVIRLLIERKADLDRVPPEGEPAIAEAVQHDQVEAIKLLAASGADVNRTGNSGQGGTPLSRAASLKRWEAVRALLDAGAAPDASGKNVSALFEAAQAGEVPIVKLLLEKGADPNLRAPGGAAPIWFPVWDGKTEVVRALLEGGADVRKDRDMLLKGLGGKPIKPEIKRLLQNPPKAKPRPKPAATAGTAKSPPKSTAAPAAPKAPAATPKSAAEPKPPAGPKAASAAPKGGPAAKGGALSDGQARGTFTMNGKQAALAYAYAIAEKGSFDPSKEDVRIILADQPLEDEALWEWFKRAALTDQKQLRAVEVVVDAGKDVISGEFRHPDKTFSATGMHVIDLKVFDGKSVEGSVRTREEGEFFGTTYSYEASFKATIRRKAPKAPASAATPADAAAAEKSAQGKLYRAYEKAVRAGDLATIKKLFAKAEGAPPLDDPKESEKVLELMKLFLPVDARLVKLTEGPKESELLVTGKDSDGSATEGRVTFLKEGTEWKMGPQKWGPPER